MNRPLTEHQTLSLHWQGIAQDVQHKPWRFGFLSLMRRLGSETGQPMIGTAARPQMEAFRLNQLPSLIFAPREIAEAALLPDGKFHVRLFGLGLWGANGPLPLHYTEIALNRRELGKDSTLMDFTDLFHHRHLTQFYRAWSAAQSAGAGLDRTQDETFSFYIASLSGQDIQETLNNPLPTHARLAASAHLIREPRNPEGLESTLTRFFGVPFHLTEFMLHWIAIDPEERTRLGIPGPAAVMGEGALVGQMVPDRQYKFRLTIGPLDLKDYLHFLPDGRDLPTLTEWIRAFVGFEYVWEICLQMNPRSVPPARIGEGQRLGWTTWLGQAADDRPVTGMIFEPEHYVGVQAM